MLNGDLWSCITLALDDIYDVGPLACVDSTTHRVVAGVVDITCPERSVRRMHVPLTLHIGNNWLYEQHVYLHLGAFGRVIFFFTAADTLRLHSLTLDCPPVYTYIWCNMARCSQTDIVVQGLGSMVHLARTMGGASRDQVLSHLTRNPSITRNPSMFEAIPPAPWS